MKRQGRASRLIGAPLGPLVDSREMKWGQAVENKRSRETPDFAAINDINDLRPCRETAHFVRRNGGL